jgi:hypothetical protein
LQGRAQGFHRGADVFLADERGTYIGRTCHWRDCRPGVRQSCDALHCGRRPHLHDDLEAIALSSALVQSPPVTLWPYVERRGELRMSKKWLRHSNTPSNMAQPTARAIVSALRLMRDVRWLLARLCHLRHRTSKGGIQCGASSPVPCLC